MENINIVLEDKEMEALNKADYLHINGMTFVRQSKCEELMNGFFKQESVKLLDWLKELPQSDKCKIEKYKEGGYGEVLLDSKELVEKFYECSPPKL